MRLIGRSFFLAAMLVLIFGKLLPILRDRQETLLNYGLPLAALSLVASLCTRSSGRQRTVRNDVFRPLFVFFAFYFLLWSAKGLLTDLPRVAVLTYLRTFLAGPFIGFTLAVMFVRTVGLEEQKRFALRLLLIASVIMVFQVAISMVESLRGESFVDYGVDGMGGLEGRDLLELTGGGLVDRFGFKLPFYGMLGQHNYFGSMLIGYNALWIAGFLLTNKSHFLALLALNLFASIGNSTRTAFISVLMMDVLMFVQLIGGVNVIIRFGKVLLIIVLTAEILYRIQQRLGDYAAGSNTFEGRVDLWASIFQDLGSGMFSPLEWVFGSAMEHVSKVGFNWRGVETGSVESQYLYMFCFGGVVSLVMFIWAVSAPLILLRKRFSAETRTLILGILFSWLFSFITLDLHLHFASMVPYVAALFVLGVAADSRATKLVRPASPLAGRPIPLTGPINSRGLRTH